MGVREIVIPYAPREPQIEIHEALNTHRFTVVVAHRRLGKTVSAINQLVKSAVMCQKERPRYAYIAPTYSQAKRVAWDYLTHFSAPLGGSANTTVDACVKHAIVDPRWQIVAFHAIPILSLIDRRNVVMRQCFHIVDADRMTAKLLPNFLRAAVVGGAAWVGRVVNKPTFVMEDASERVFPVINHFFIKSFV